MLEVAVIALRWLQYGGGVVLLGAPLFLLDSFKDADAPNLEWSRPTLRLAAIIVSGYDGDAVRQVERQLGRVAPAARDIKVWGPTPAFYALLRGQTRERLLVQAARSVDVQAYLKAWLILVKAPSAVRVTVDVDPMSFY